MLSPDAARTALDQGIDRKLLKTIKQRFLQVNNARLARTRSALGVRQQMFLELLPLLYHINHPMLPGYVSHQAPCGLSDYNPGKGDLLRAQRLWRSFTYRRQPAIRRRIYSLFLMGSCGTVAQSDSSDLDVWICHQPGLDEEELQQLRKKADGISQWAQELGLEAHFFLMEGEQFKQGARATLSGEDCGSSQHFLLLDEFYRTGLLLAGRIPIWWLIPPDAESLYDQYADTLRNKRFVRDSDTLDFGGVGSIPAGEFVGAGVWQLYKAIDSPYKSVIKILLTEVYAAEYPAVEPLSTTFKKAIYANQLDIDELDPYVMMYRKLERHLLARGEHERLALVRRCFYFKVGKMLSRGSRSPAKSWQRVLLEKLVIEWQWPSEQLFTLDTRNKWKVGRVIAEQKELVRELTNSYRFLLEFARRTRATALINSQEMTVLGRKLYAAFERKAGKIEWINPGIAPDLREEELHFYVEGTDAGGTAIWAVASEMPRDRDRDLRRVHSLKKADSLLALLCWAHFNGLLDTQSKVQIVEGQHRVSELELNQIVRALRQQLPVAREYSDLDSDQQERFARPLRPLQLMLFINVGADPMANIRSQGIERISDRTDSLGYSGLRENLVINVEQITINSWGEISTRRYEGEFALLHCLREYFQLLPPGTDAALPRLDIRCFCPTRSAAIAQRVEELFRDIIACYYSGTRTLTTRYVLEIQREYFVLNFGKGRPEFVRAETYQALLDQLAREQTSYSPITLDRYCMRNTLLSLVLHNGRPDSIQIFYHQGDQQADIYVLDEMGSLYVFNTPFLDQSSLLLPLDQFIQSMLFRRHGEFGDVDAALNGHASTDELALEYYQIIDKQGPLHVKRRALMEEETPRAFMSLQAIGDRDSDGRVTFTLYCDQQEFSELEHGTQLFAAVATFVLDKRRNRERYPLYITDLDLSRCVTASSGKVQTVHYLRFKEKLERALNSALQNL